MSNMLPLEITKEIQKRPFGRTLSDFRSEDATTPNALFPAEERLLIAVAKGDPCQIGAECPLHPTQTNTIRAEFVRFLLLGGDNNTPVHESGVMVLGAYIDGSIDLHNAETVAAFSLIDCNIDGDIVGLDAKLKSICLTGTRIYGVVCDRANISGSVFLDGRFAAKEPVRFQGASLSGSLYCTGGSFHNKAAANECDAASEDALSLEGARVNGSLVFGGSTCSEKMTVEGCLNLQNATVTSFVDVPSSWPRESHVVSNTIKLDGFVYGRFLGTTPLDTATRVKWLKRQPKAHLYEDFRPQPFEQLEKVLRVMGHKAEARDICFLKDRYYIRSRYINFCKKPEAKSKAVLQPLAYFWWRLVLRGLLEVVSVTFRNLHLMTAVVVLLVVGSGFVYQSAAEQGLFAPTDPDILFDPVLRSSCVPNCAEIEKNCAKPSAAAPKLEQSDANTTLVARSMWIGHNRISFWPSLIGFSHSAPPAACGGTCKANWTGSACNLKRLLPEYPSFSPFVYALDVVLPPGMNLRQASSWRIINAPFHILGLATSGAFLQSFVWLKTLVFWFWAVSAVWVLGSILKRD